MKVRDLHSDQLHLFTIRKVLFIASEYDAFLLEEDSSLEDLVENFYRHQNSLVIPQFTRVSTNQEALQKLVLFNADLIIYCIRSLGKSPTSLFEEVQTKYPSIPVVFLLYPMLQLIPDSSKNGWDESVDLFLWNGDGRIIASILRFVEDQQNALTDSQFLPIPIILFVEDNIRYYSSYLTLLYETLWKETQKLYTEDTPISRKIFLQKTCTKVLLAKTYEQAIEIFNRYSRDIIGVITDMEYPMQEGNCDLSGLTLMKKIWEKNSQLPVILQSSTVCHESCIKEHQVVCIQKTSPSLLADIRDALTQYFGFGNLLFKDQAGNIQTKVPNIRSFYEIIASLSPSSIQSRVRTGELKRWFLIHGEYELAESFIELIHPDTPAETLLDTLTNLLKQEIYQKNKGSIINYSRKFPLRQWTIGKIGTGSIGGKARGLSFFNKVLVNRDILQDFSDIHLFIPQTIIIGTDVFDDFITKNQLSGSRLENLSDAQITRIFLQSNIPATIIGDLRDVIQQMRYPLVIRSSSLLEDALYHPFAGIYSTKMIPNNEVSFDMRFTQLCNAIKLVYASTFLKSARSYMNSTGFRVEEEKMAILIQRIVGSKKNTYFYPEGSGVIRSYNYYPFRNALPEDGIMQLAMGLGKTIVNGETTLQFCPKIPTIVPQLSSIDSSLETTQKKFWALRLNTYRSSLSVDEDEFMVQFPITEGMNDSMQYFASTYSRENDRLFEGIHRTGPKVITFYSLLNPQYSRFSEFIQVLLEECQKAMQTPIEIECAFTLNPEIGKLDFGFLQVRPMMKFDAHITLSLAEIKESDSLCYTDNALGNGSNQDLYSLILVHPERFNLAKTQNIALEINALNQWFSDKKQYYILMGPGRWGSSDPWLGIGVQWHQISQTKAFVEYDLPNLHIDPSQGSHFFQNITSLQIPYLTIAKNHLNQQIDWKWLLAQKPVDEKEYVSVFSFSEPFSLEVDGKNSIGVIRKPPIKK